MYFTNLLKQIETVNENILCVELLIRKHDSITEDKSAGQFVEEIFSKLDVRSFKQMSEIKIKDYLETMYCLIKNLETKQMRTDKLEGERKDLKKEKERLEIALASNNTNTSGIFYFIFIIFIIP